MKILVNEIDIYKSSINKTKKISEYIIYLMFGNIPIEAFIEYGVEAKNKKINELTSLYRINNNIITNFLIN